MAVHYTGGGGGLLGTLGKVLSLGASFIPGLQPFAPFIGAAGAAMNGDPAGAVGSLAGAIMPNTNIGKIGGQITPDQLAPWAEEYNRFNPSYRRW